MGGCSDEVLDLVKYKIEGFGKEEGAKGAPLGAAFFDCYVYVLRLL